MKIAALYDIHGNLPALHAVLEELKEIRPDLLVIGGDVISGPLPAQTLQRLMQADTQVRFLRGNNDREVIAVSEGQPVTRRYLPAMSEQGREEVRWIVGQLTRAQLDFLASWPEQEVLQVDGLGSILFCHATPRSDEEIFTPITPTERLNTLFAGVVEDIVVCGHTHIQFERQMGHLRILNAGSVGMPFAAQPGAYWLLLGPTDYEFRCTVYDSEAAARAMQGSTFARTFAEENVLTMPPTGQMIEILEEWSRQIP